MMKMIKYVNGTPLVDYDELKKSLRIATEIVDIISIQELDLYTWDENTKDDRVIGTSFTGYQDFLNVVNISKKEETEMLKLMKKYVLYADINFSKQHNVIEASLRTSCQPAGTVSILPDSVSAGFHWSHSPYYKRRIRVNTNDPISKAMVESGFSWKPEVAQTVENHTTKVFEFPVKAPKGRTKLQVSAIEQLESYKLLMDNYVEHNVSATIHVRNHEWDDVEQWIWDNWDSFVGLSFLSLDDNFYELLPYEEITEDEYNKMVLETPVFNTELISNYETHEEEFDIGSDCESGACPIR